MTTYPNIYNEPELLKLKTRDDEIRNLNSQTEKHDHENIEIYLSKMKMNIIKRNINHYIKRKNLNLSLKYWLDCHPLLVH